MPRDLAAIVGELTDVNTELVEAAAAGDHLRVQALATRARELETRRNRLLRPSTAPSSEIDRYDPVSTRDRIIQTLQIANRPASAQLIADLARAVLGTQVLTTLLASLRRDERNSWDKARDPTSRVAPRDIYVVPALAADRFTPVRATLALSHWPLPTRLITPSSPRVDLLYVVLALADVIDRDRAADPASATSLLGRLARSLPGYGGWTASASTVEAREAARQELDVIEARDEQERDEAADRAQTQLDADQLLFGAAPLRTAPSRRRAAQ